ncbi:hypothetical protein D3C76_1106080 [compost metagenome]
MDFRGIAGKQQRRGLGQTLVEFLDGHLLQVRVEQPDFLAVGDQQLLLRGIGVPAEQAGAFQAELAGGFLQAGAAAVQGQLGEARGHGLGLAQQPAQALRGNGVVGVGLYASKGEGGNQQHADQSHEFPRMIQSRIGAGAMTSREPLVFIAVTTPAISMASIIRAARL